ncbi:MAG: DUF971 domain-containing protein [Burkholderiales bacterium]|nr:DUF971 domain-containing protein [Burkholderiales bacterium]
MTTSKPQPTALNARTQACVLEIAFDDGKNFSLPFELLRVYSPSAEVRGHGAGQETLQTGKRLVNLLGIEPVGNYAVRPLFSDGHSTGIFSWEYLYWLGDNATQLWQDYLEKLQAAGFTGESGRDAPMADKAGSACASKH